MKRKAEDSENEFIKKLKREALQAVTKNGHSLQ